MRKIAFVWAAILIILLGLPLYAGAYSGKVVAVLDGDTIEVMHRGKAARVRLQGIDCPGKGQAYGNKAKQFTAEMVMGKEVTVKTAGRDNYGRTLGTVLLPDGRNLNRELVRAGLAWWYRHYSGDGSLGDLEAEARDAHRGLWQDPHPIPPWEYRRKKAKS